MIYTMEHEDRRLHAILFNNNSRTHLVWMVASWTRLPKTTDQYIDWAAYIGAVEQTLSIEGSILEVRAWGAKLNEQAARAYFGEIADRYEVGYRS